jgi:hypothetical protein
MRGPLRWALASRPKSEAPLRDRSAQNRGEAPSPSGASRPATSPRAAGRGEAHYPCLRRASAAMLRSLAAISALPPLGVP